MSTVYTNFNACVFVNLPVLAVLEVNSLASYRQLYSQTNRERKKEQTFHAIDNLTWV
jgi:hypothetical protein